MITNTKLERNRSCAPQRCLLYLVCFILMVILSNYQVQSWDDYPEHKDDCYLDHNPEQKHLDAFENEENCGSEWTAPMDMSVRKTTKIKEQQQKSSLLRSRKLSPSSKKRIDSKKILGRGGLRDYDLKINYPAFCKNNTRRRGGNYISKKQKSNRVISKRDSYFRYKRVEEDEGQDVDVDMDMDIVQQQGYKLGKKKRPTIRGDPSWTTPKPQPIPVRARKGLISPWTVMITVNDIKCAGVIIAKDVVLTSGKCIWPANYKPEPIKVYAGRFSSDSSNIQELLVQNICYHESFDLIDPYMPMRPRDYALLKVKKMNSDEGFNWDNQVALPICVPTYKENERYGNQDCYATGWGDVKSPKEGGPETFYVMDLKEGQCKYKGIEGMNYHPSVKCFDRHEWATVQDGIPIKRVCSGDIGGPVVCRNKEANKWYLAGLIMGSEDVADCESNRYDGQARFTDINVLRREIFRLKYAILNNKCNGTRVLLD